MVRSSVYKFMLAACVIFFAFSCRNKEESETCGKVTVKFIPVWNGEVVTIDSIYTNSLNQRLRFENITSYFSNIYLGNGLDSVLFSSVELLQLLGGEAAVSKNIKPGSYSKISFGIGVPPELNKNVDPSVYPNSSPLSVQGSNGMFWYWNTGYIFFKLDGRADTTGVAGAPLLQPFAYHCGDDPLFRKKAFSFATIQSEDFTNHEISVYVDMQLLMEGSNDPLDMRTDYITHTTGNFTLAERVTNHFSNAFTIVP
ncbi:MAG: MbnP family protein [Bacteroidota bacterium]